MCSTCLAEAMDAAYCDGFKTEDDEYIILEDDEPVVFNHYGEIVDEYD